MPTLYIDKDTKLPDRVEFDFYPTPIELCRIVVSNLSIGYPKLVLDPGAGTGVWGRALREEYPNSKIVGIEIRDVSHPKEYDVWVSGDFLKMVKQDTFNLVIGNPPYRCAGEFLNKSLNIIKDNGYIVFLLKLSFLESKDRFIKYYSKGLNPKEVWVSVRRVSFTGNRKSNADAYGIFIWQKGYMGDTILRWLDWSYDEER